MHTTFRPEFDAPAPESEHPARCGCCEVRGNPATCEECWEAECDGGPVCYARKRPGDAGRDR